jgi:hypothetical protein
LPSLPGPHTLSAMIDIETSSQHETAPEPVPIFDAATGAELLDERAESGHADRGASWQSRALRWAAKLSFLFFFLKGIAWLVLGWLAWVGLT